MAKPPFDEQTIRYRRQAREFAVVQAVAALPHMQAGSLTEGAQKIFDFLLAEEPVPTTEDAAAVPQTTVAVDGGAIDAARLAGGTVDAARRF